MVLQGTEVKSLRAGRASLVDGFAEIDDHEAWLHGVHIPEYTQGTWTNHPARRKRKLLLNRPRSTRSSAGSTSAGLTIVPLSLYFKDGRAKIEIALAKGKKTYDKRHALAERQAEPRGASRRSAVGSRASERWLSLLAGRRRPRLVGGARAPRPVRRARALPAAAGDAQGPRAVRHRRPADRPAVAAGLPRRRRRAGGAAARPRRTPLHVAALRAPARASRRTSTPGRPSSPPPYPSACASATFYPEDGVGGYVAELVAAGTEVFKVHVQVGDFDLLDPLLDDAWGTARRGRHAGRRSTPAGDRSATTTPAPARCARCWSGTRR